MSEPTENCENNANSKQNYTLLTAAKTAYSFCFR